MEIPGYYYDESKKKYFKITKNDVGPSKYSLASIKEKQNEAERSRKRVKLQNNFISQVPFMHYEGLKIGSRLDLLSSNQTLFNFQGYLIKKLENKGSMKTRGRLNSDTFKKVFCKGQKLLVSSLNNMYEIDFTTFSLDTSQELFPMLKVHRVDKVASILRDLTVIDVSYSQPILRTWFGNGQNEPSEVELSVQDFNYNIVSRANVQSSKYESFNNLVYNHNSESIVVCGSKNVLRYNAQLLNQSRQIIYQGADVLSIDSKDRNIYFLGLRNGQTVIVDDRLDNKSSKQRHNTSRKGSSVINIKSVHGNRVLCSFLGSKLRLFDIRMGFKNSLMDYRTAKDIEDVFGERVEIIDNDLIKIQNPSLCEFFKLSNPNPLKTVEYGFNDRVVDSCFNNEKQFYRLITTDGKNIRFYD